MDPDPDLEAPLEITDPGLEAPLEITDPGLEALLEIEAMMAPEAPLEIEVSE